MRSLEEIYGNIAWNVNFNKVEVREALRRYLNTDLTNEEVVEETMRFVNVSDLVSLNNIRDGLRCVVSSYRKERRPRSATEVLRELNNYVQSLKRDISNALCFGLDQADYSEEEIQALNDLLGSVKAFRSNLSLRDKYRCQGCEECASNGRRGCKVRNNEVRAREWGILI